MTESKPLKDRRIGDPFLDRRCGDDRREAYELGYFAHGGVERRRGVESRTKDERRAINMFGPANGQAYVQKQNRLLNKGKLALNFHLN